MTAAYLSSSEPAAEGIPFFISRKQRKRFHLNKIVKPVSFNSELELIWWEGQEILGTNHSLFKNGLTSSKYLTYYPASVPQSDARWALRECPDFSD